LSNIRPHAPTRGVPLAIRAETCQQRCEQQKQEHFELGAAEREGMESSTLRPCWYGNWDRLPTDHRA
jgi:hypothetical protein